MKQFNFAVNLRDCLGLSDEVYNEMFGEFLVKTSNFTAHYQRAYDIGGSTIQLSWNPKDKWNLCQ